MSPLSPTSQSQSAALNALVRGLAKQEFVFILAEDSEKALREQVDKADKTTTEIGNKLLGFALQAAPGFVQTLCEHAVSFNAAKVDNAELADLLASIKVRFPLSAVTYSATHGIRFVPILDGSTLSQSDLGEALAAFTAINLALMPLANRISLELLGKPVIKADGSSATGSMILLAPTTERAEELRIWSQAQPLRNDTALNQAKAAFGRPLFWVKAAVGMMEHQPHQLRQEIVVIDGTRHEATSTSSPRMDFEFGFGLADIAGRR